MKLDDPRTMNLKRAYRRTGADLPGTDPRPSHGAEMEGYFWRITDVLQRRVVVVLCGVNRSPTGPWATVALATDPGGFVRSVAAPDGWADPDRYRVSVPGVLEADADHLSVDLGPDATADLELGPRFEWPLRLGGGGIFSAVPFLGQYWHPHVLDGEVSGKVRAGGSEWEIGGAQLYAEKNWGRGFPPFWWWGQAHGFERPDVTVAFSGGRLEAGPFGIVVGGVVARIGREVIRLTPPTARVHTSAEDGTWQVNARGHGYAIAVTGVGDPSLAHVLPVPVPAERTNADTDFEHLRGRMTLEIRKRGALLFEGTSDLAGLEVGVRPPGGAGTSVSAKAALSRR